jgi:hypothetical protein
MMGTLIDELPGTRFKNVVVTIALRILSVSSVV